MAAAVVSNNNNNNNNNNNSATTAAAITEAEERLTAFLRAQEQKDLLRFVTIGSVDDGKSTLIGRLLHDAHGVYTDQLEAVRRVSSTRGSTRGGASEIDFSLFTDGLMAEREQGITIDVAYRYFATSKRKFIIADTPGHVQYTRNMATGASTAGAAVILVDARLGVLPQTRRHLHIAALLGIPHVIACVNKMDLIDFDQTRFDAIAKELGAIAKELGTARDGEMHSLLLSLHPIPVSALAGDNVVASSDRTPWWSGGTLLEMLETVDVNNNDNTVSAAQATTRESFRMPVQIVLRPNLTYRGFAGRIASGSIRTGDEIVVLPSRKRTRVAGVDVAGVDVREAFAPMNVALRFTDEIDVSRGDMLVRASADDNNNNNGPQIVTELDADIVWMSERALDPDRTYLIKHTTRIVRASIRSAHGLGAVTLNDIARVHVTTSTPIFVDPYATNRQTGAFIVIDSVTNDTVAAAMIVSSSSSSLSRREETRGELPKTTTQVSITERRARLGQTGVAATVSARTIAAARALAFEVERELFDRGRAAIVVDTLAEAEACARGGLIAIVPVVAEEDQNQNALLITTALTEASDDQAR